MRTQIFIATSRPIGERCRGWAEVNLPEGFDFADRMEDCDIFISVMYEKLIDENFIKSRKKCFNIHPGVLPWYRGAGAYTHAILNGEMETGVTLHEIDKDIDHGPVLSIKRFPIYEHDTAESLFRQAEEKIFEMFREWFPRLLTGDYKAIRQSEGKIYYRKDLEKMKNITRIARAFHFSGKEQAFYYNKKGEKIYLQYEA